MGIVKRGCGKTPDDEVLSMLDNLNEHRKITSIIFTNKRLRGFFRMLYDYVQGILERHNGNKENKNSQGGRT